MKEQVEIVMATYNGEKYIKEQLDSLLSQSYPDLLVDVCDDGSTDGTVSIVKEYEKKDSRVRLFENKTNQGYIRNFTEKKRRWCKVEGYFPTERGCHRLEAPQVQIPFEISHRSFLFERNSSTSRRRRTCTLRIPSACRMAGSRVVPRNIQLRPYDGTELSLCV